ncbi:MAG: hypothetical protein ACTHM8_03055 [Sphingomonas sp.]
MQAIADLQRRMVAAHTEARQLRQFELSAVLAEACAVLDKLSCTELDTDDCGSSPRATLS